MSAGRSFSNCVKLVTLSVPWCLAVQVVTCALLYASMRANVRVADVRLCVVVLVCCVWCVNVSISLYLCAIGGLSLDILLWSFLVTRWSVQLGNLLKS